MTWKRGFVVMTGVLAMGAVCCASGYSRPPEGGATGGTGTAPTVTAERPEVWIQVNADCTVDKEEAHVSEAKKQEAHWTLSGDPGPLGIEFKLAKGKGAFQVSQVSATEVKATIKQKDYGSHPYRIRIGDKECPDPVLIIDP